MNHQSHTVEASPDNEHPRGAVPQARYEHGDEEVEVRTPTAATTAAKREVEIIAEPGGEADVPAVPKQAKIGRASCRGRV